MVAPDPKSPRRDSRAGAVSAAHATGGSVPGGVPSGGATSGGAGSGGAGSGGAASHSGGPRLPGDLPPGDPRAGTLLHRLVRGFLLPFQGLRYMVRHPVLWTYALVPVVVTGLLLAGLLAALLAWADDLTALVWAPPDSTWLQALWWLLYAGVFAGVFAVGAVSLPGLVTSPFNDALSERTEALALGARPETPFSVGGLLRDTAGTLLDELGKVALLLGGHALLLPLLLIPAVGSVLYPPTAGTWTILWLSAEYLEFPMSRNGHRFRAVRRVVRENPALAVGFGGAVFVILAVPLLNVLFVPVSVVGGTLLYARLRRAGALPPPTRGGGGLHGAAGGAARGGGSAADHAGDL